MPLLVRIGLFRLFSLLFFYANVLAAEPVALLYPAVKEPFRTVFLQIANGARSELGDRLLLQELDDNYPDTASVQRWLTTQKTSGLILLGARGYKLAHELTGPQAMVVGAAPFSPNGIAGVSLANDPRVVFTYLSKLTPQTRTIFIVHSDKQRWLIHLAQQAASRSGLVLNTIEVSEFKAAALEYKKLASVMGDTSALWILADDLATSDDSILSYLLKAAWDKRFVLFSSTPAHVKRGAMFSFLPDNEAMGRELAKLLLALQQNKTVQTVMPLSHLRLAINTRTISHLGITLTDDVRRDVALSFPVQ